MATPSASVHQFLSRVCKRTTRVVAKGEIEILHLDGYPRGDVTTLVTVGLAEHELSMYRGLPTAFELTATTAERADDLASLLATAVTDDISAHARGDAHLRVTKLPPRGVVYNGAFAATRAPHLLFASDLLQAPELAGRHRIGRRYIVFLPAIPLTDGELADYDASPVKLMARLRELGVDALTRRMGSIA